MGGNVIWDGCGVVYVEKVIDLVKLYYQDDMSYNSMEFYV